MKTVDRMPRVDELMRREIADYLERTMEHTKDCMVSVTHVKTSSDLRTARVEVSFMGSPEAKAKAMASLERVRVHLQADIARNLRFKYTPVLHFVFDPQMESGDRILRMLDGIKAEASDA
jgi:ribosome-binding factor A